MTTYIGTTGLVIMAMITGDLTDAVSCVINVRGPGESELTPVPASWVSPVVTHNITFSIGDYVKTTPGIYYFQPIVTYEDGRIVPADPFHIQVYDSYIEVD